MTTTVDIAIDEDYCAWAYAQAQALPEGRLTDIDIDNIAEELEDLGKSQKRELTNRLAVLIAHLLTWQHQDGFRATAARQLLLSNVYPMRLLRQHAVDAFIMGIGKRRLIERFHIHHPVADQVPDHLVDKKVEELSSMRG